ncbi:MAG: hypothetical protein HY318_16340 [Armatimonadetes bacterium]|nr:hypothetical protein [Armatimonadota bacterium]
MTRPPVKDRVTTTAPSSSSLRRPGPASVRRSLRVAPPSTGFGNLQIAAKGKPRGGSTEGKLVFSVAYNLSDGGWLGQTTPMENYLAQIIAEDLTKTAVEKVKPSRSKVLRVAQDMIDLTRIQPLPIEVGGPLVRHVVALFNSAHLTTQEVRDHIFNAESLLTNAGIPPEMTRRLRCDLNAVAWEVRAEPRNRQAG